MDSGPNLICPRCGAENPAGRKFCQRCWGLLRGPTCPHCGKQATRAGARYCEHCGRDLFLEPSPEASQPLVGIDELLSQLPEPLPEKPPDAPSIQQGIAEQPPALPTERTVAEQPEKPSLATEATEQTVPSWYVVMSESSAPSWLRWRRGLLIAFAAITVVVIAFAGGLAIRWHETATANRGTHPSSERKATARGDPASGPSLTEASSVETSGPPASAGTLRISTVPVGAQVELDGAMVGVTALTLTEVKPGRHTVKISKPGFRSVNRELDIAAGETLVLDLPLSSAPPPPVQRRRGPAAPPLPPPPPVPLPPPPRP